MWRPYGVVSLLLLTLYLLYFESSYGAEVDLKEEKRKLFDELSQLFKRTQNTKHATGEISDIHVDKKEHDKEAQVDERSKLLDRLENLLKSREEEISVHRKGVNLVVDTKDSKVEEQARELGKDDDGALVLDYEDYAPHANIHFKDLRLNKKAKIPMSKQEKREFMRNLQPYLHGQTISERMKVWSAMADIEKHLEDQGSDHINNDVEKKSFTDEKLTDFDIEENGDYEGDIILDNEDVQMLKDNIEQRKLDDEKPDERLNANLRSLAKDLAEYKDKRTKGDVHSDDLKIDARVNNLNEMILDTLEKLSKKEKPSDEKHSDKETDDKSSSVAKRDTVTTEHLQGELRLLYDELDKRTVEDDDGNDDGALDMDRRKLSAQMTKWSFPIKYTFDGTHNDKQVAMINKAIFTWELETCIRFQHVKDEPRGPHIIFHKAPGCSSRVGMKKDGNQVTLSDKCFLIGKIEHELGHVLGMWHEQSRPDREEYVKINRNLIKEGKFKNFEKMSWKLTKSYGVPYDLSSDMHYGGTYFKKNGKKGYTIQAKDHAQQKVMGQRYTMSFLDVKLINYGYCANVCPGYSTLQWAKCLHDGYRDPNNCDQCKCPEGWEGKYCDKIAQGKSKRCGNTILDASEDVSRYLKSPGYDDDGYTRGETCNWIIKAPAGKQVVAKFVGDFEIRSNKEMECKYPFCWDWVEVRDGSLGMAGSRLCCHETPKEIFRSSGNKLMVLFRSHFKYNDYRGFKLKYYAVSCGGCTSSQPSLQHACLKTVEKNCPGKFGEKCGLLGWRTCFKYRKNMCVKTTEYCCKGGDPQSSMCLLT